MTMRPTRRAVLAGALAPLASQLSAQTTPSRDVQRWDLFELQLDGPRDGNPFLDVQFSAEFRQQHRTVTVDGFYDGGGVYKVRFSPDAEGEWTYVTHSNRRELDGKTGAFLCVAPSRRKPRPGLRAQHLPLRLRRRHAVLPVRHHLLRLDASGRRAGGADPRHAAHAPFNKMRMCVFPKWYAYNQDEPPVYPFPRSAQGENDYTRFDPEFFRHLETRIGQLQALGIEADLILFHPYDHWGYALMPPEADDRYLRYVVARLAAYRNVWWSVANEWDFVKGKTLADWDRYFRIVQESDPYRHLRSIHHNGVMYDHAKPWVTHASIQGDDSRGLPSGDHLSQAGRLRRVQVRGQHSQALGQYLRAGDDAPLLAGHDVRRLRRPRRDLSRPARHPVVVQGRRAARREPARIAFLRGIVEAGPAEGLRRWPAPTIRASRGPASIISTTSTTTSPRSPISSCPPEAASTPTSSIRGR